MIVRCDVTCSVIILWIFPPCFSSAAMRGHTTLSGRSWLCCMMPCPGLDPRAQWTIGGFANARRYMFFRFFYCRWYSMFLLCWTFWLNKFLLVAMGSSSISFAMWRSLIWISWNADAYMAIYNMMCGVLHHLTWLLFLSCLLSWRWKKRGVVTFVKFVFCWQKSHLNMTILDLIMFLKDSKVTCDEFMVVIAMFNLFRGS